jgi:hypothetical protein
LALRHLPAFADADVASRTAGAPSETYERAFTKRRRRLVTLFADTWLDCARGALKQDTAAAWPTDALSSVGVGEVVHAYVRTSMLTDDVMAPLVPLAVLAHLLQQRRQAPRDAAEAAEQRRIETAMSVALMGPHALPVRGQSIASDARINAAVAARRVDVVAANTHRVGAGVLDLVERVSGLRVDNDAAEPRNYVFGVGDNLGFTVSTHVLDFATLGGRPLDVRKLSRFARAVAGETIVYTGDDAAMAEDIVILRHASRPVGVQRHPLVISAHQKRVQLFAASVPAALPATRTEPFRSLHDAISYMTTPSDKAGDAGYVTARRVQRVRACAFNAERFAYALLVAGRAWASPPTRIYVRVAADTPSADDTAVAVALGVALYESVLGSATGLIATGCLVQTASERDSIDARLNAVADKLDAAAAAGLSLALVSELVTAAM